MSRSLPTRLAIAIAALLTLPMQARAEPDAGQLYAEHCASCHGAERLGGQGPALLPQNLGRLTGSRLVSVIADGRPATRFGWPS